MTSTAFVNVSANAVSSQSSTVKRHDSKEKSSLSAASTPKSDQKSLFNAVAELDNKIEKLEKESQEAKGSWFGKAYNIFSKKDNKLEEELKELKEVRKAAQADGVVTQQELDSINKEYSEANSSLNTYKDGKKSAADTTATVAAIGAGIAVSAATGGVGGVIIAAATAGATKVASKEAMLGDDYNATGKEGLKDFGTQAAWSLAGGAAGMATKGASTVVKVVAQVGKDQAMLAATNENYREALKEGDVKTIASTVAVSATAGYAGARLAPANSLTGKIARAEAITFGKAEGKALINQGSQVVIEKIANDRKAS